jgi:hypothetical protein
LEQRVERLARQRAAHHVELVAAQAGAADAVVVEGLPSVRDPRLHQVGHHLGVDADLVLGVGVDAQAEEVEEVVEVDLPVPLGVVVEREVHPGELAGEPGGAGSTGAPSPRR